MPKGRQLVFSYQGLAEALAKQQGFRAGPWGDKRRVRNRGGPCKQCSRCGPGDRAIVPPARTTTQGYGEEASGLAGDAAGAMSAHEKNLEP